MTDTDAEKKLDEAFTRASINGQRDVRDLAVRVVPIVIVGAIFIVLVMHVVVEYVLTGTIEIVPERTLAFQAQFRNIDISVFVLTIFATSVFLWFILSEFRELVQRDVRKYMLAIESSNDHIVITDVDGFVIYANHSAEKITGYTFGEMRGNTPRLWGALMPADFYKDLWRTIKYDRKPFYAEIKNRRKNQDEYWATVRIAPIVDRKKFLLGFIATEEDITERKQQEDALVTAKAQDDAILSSISEALVATDREGKILFINTTTERLLGWRPEKVVGKPLSELSKVTDEKGNPVPWGERPMARAFASGAVSSAQSYFYTREDGTRFPVSLNAAPIVEGSKVVGVVGMLHDMTKEKEIEKLRMDFLALASHQLRTPLSGTRWLIETLKRGILGPMNKRQTEYMDEVYSVNGRMIQLVNDMLDALRITGGALVIKKEEIPASKLFVDIIGMMGLTAREGEIVLKNALENKPAIVAETDPMVVKRILESFVSNAIVYSHPGGEVVLDAQEGADGGVTLSVTDHGIGIPQDEKAHILERFYRASNAKGLKPEGTGLGLYIAAELAEKIGAKITFESKEGEGSVFHLNLPPHMVQ